MNRRSKLPHKILEAKLDALWAQRVKEYARGKCFHCGSIYQVDAHHIIKRRYTATRWLLTNGMALCRDCHAKVEDKRLTIVCANQSTLEYLARQVTPRTNEFMLQAWYALNGKV